ncbi:MAG TPA: hypothetical protein VJ371_08010 [Streptosporangiaceae bacterium]|nr:hypothetical protein [Streptosporangiaceae bacterium]
MYALARHRFGTPKWLAAVMTLPVLYDGFEIQLEHLILSDVPFLFVLMLATTLLLWDPEGPSTRRSAVIGLLLGLGAVLRSIGLPLLAIFAVYMIIKRFNWRRIVAAVGVCLIPVFAYAGAFDLQHGQFAMSDATGIFLYSRVMTFADCAKMQLSPDLLSLCTTVPPAQRPIAQAYIWTAASPLHRFPAPVFSALPNSLAQQFAIKAIEAQPAAYARAVFDDTWRSFDWSRSVFPNAETYDEYLFGYQSVPISSGHPVPGYSSSAAAYLAGGNPLTAVVNPFAGAIRVYQRYVWLPGTVYGLLLLAGLGAIVAGRRRVSVDALLPWVSSVALIVVPAATAEFDYRYVTTAVPFACLALAIAFGRRPAPAPVTAPDSGAAAEATQPAEGAESAQSAEASGAAPVTGTSVPSGGATSLPRRVPGGGSGNGTVQPGHDERDFAPDTP